MKRTCLRCIFWIWWSYFSLVTHLGWLEAKVCVSLEIILILIPHAKPFEWENASAHLMAFGQEEYLFENIVVSYEFDIILLFVGHGMESVCSVRSKLVGFYNYYLTFQLKWASGLHFACCFCLPFLILRPNPTQRDQKDALA